MKASTSSTKEGDSSNDKDGQLLFPDEIRIWVGEKEKSIRGLSAETTCSHIVHSLLKHSKLANVKTLQSHAIYQKWPEYQIQLKGHTKILEEFKRCQDTNFAVTFHMQKLPSAYSSTGGGGVYSNSNSGNVSHSPYLHATLFHCSNTVGSPDQNAENFAQGHKSRSETSLFKQASRRGRSLTGEGHPNDGGRQKFNRSKRNSSCHSALRRHYSTDAGEKILANGRRRSEGDNYTTGNPIYDSDSSVAGGDTKPTSGGKSSNDGMSRKIRLLKLRRHATSLVEIQSGVGLSIAKEQQLNENHQHSTTFFIDQQRQLNRHASFIDQQRLAGKEMIKMDTEREQNNHVDKMRHHPTGSGVKTSSVMNNNDRKDENYATKMKTDKAEDNFNHFTTTTLAGGKKNNKISTSSGSSSATISTLEEGWHQKGTTTKPSPVQTKEKSCMSNNKSCHGSGEQIQKTNLYCRGNTGDIKNELEDKKNMNENSNSRAQNVSPLFEARNRRRNRKNSSRRGSIHNSGSGRQQISNLSESEYFRYKQNVEMQHEELSELQQRIENVEKQILYLTQSTIVSNESSLDNSLNQSAIRSHQQNGHPRSTSNGIPNRTSTINISSNGFMDNYCITEPNSQLNHNSASEITRIYADIQAVQRKLEAQNFLSSKLETELEEMKRKYVCPKCQIVYRNSKCLCSVLEDLEQSKNRTQAINKESSYVEGQINQVEQDIMKHTMRIQRLEYEIDFYTSKVSNQRTGRVPLRGVHHLDMGSNNRNKQPPSRSRVRSVDAVLDKKLTRAQPMKIEKGTRKRNETDSDTGLGSLSTEEDVSGVQLVVAKTTQIVI